MYLYELFIRHEPEDTHEWWVCSEKEKDVDGKLKVVTEKLASFKTEEEAVAKVDEIEKEGRLK